MQPGGWAGLKKIAPYIGCVRPETGLKNALAKVKKSGKLLYINTVKMQSFINF
jgi:hypothetical protein